MAEKASYQNPEAAPWRASVQSWNLYVYKCKTLISSLGKAWEQGLYFSDSECIWHKELKASSSSALTTESQSFPAALPVDRGALGGN